MSETVQRKKGLWLTEKYGKKKWFNSNKTRTKTTHRETAHSVLSIERIERKIQDVDSKRRVYNRGKSWIAKEESTTKAWWNQKKSWMNQMTGISQNE